MELTAKHLIALREAAEAEVNNPTGNQWMMLSAEILLALVERAERFMAEGEPLVESQSEIKNYWDGLDKLFPTKVPFGAEELVTAKGTEETIRMDQTCHYERRDDGFCIVRTRPYPAKTESEEEHNCEGG